MISQLQNKNYRFIKVRAKTKYPCEVGWGLNEIEWEQLPDKSWKHRLTGKRFENKDGTVYYGPRKNYSWNDKELVEWIKAGNNYGSLGGYGNNVMVDADSILIQKLIEEKFPKTLTCKSGGTPEDNETKAKKHYYFESTDAIEKTVPLHKDKNTNIGHIRWHNGMLVGPGCTHPSGAKYDVIEDVPIAKISGRKLLEVLKPYILKEQKKEITDKVLVIKAENGKNTFSDHKFDSLRVENIVSTAKLTDKGNGTLQGAHPFHASDTQWDFEINTNKNVWHCFNHNVGGGPFELIAMEAGILSCSDCGPGCLKDKEKFKRVLAIAQEKYGLKKKVVEQEPTKTNLSPITFAEIRKMKPDRNYLVQGLLKPGTAVMEFGEPGCTKSVKANLLALCVATGSPYLSMKTKKAGVVLVDNENGLEKIRERLVGSFNGLKKKRSPKNLWVFSRIGNIDSPTITSHLLEFCKENKVKLFIMDTLRRCTTAEENSSSEINAFFQNTVLPLQKAGLCVLFLHHSQKGGNSYRGSSDLLGFVDSAFSITKNGDKIKIKCEKSRGMEPEQIDAEWSFEPENYRLIRLDSLEVEQETRAKKKEVGDSILKVFLKHDHLRRGEIIDLLEAAGHDFALSAIKRSLKFLILSRELTKDDKGKYAKVGQEELGSLR